MTRCFAAAAIALVLVVFGSVPLRAQTNENSSSDLQCFPWQEMKNGRCVAKPVAATPPAPDSSTDKPSTDKTFTDPCGLRSLSSQCKCPAATHLDTATGTCVADAPATPTPTVTLPVAPRPAIAMVCSGGTVTNGACVCPAGFSLLSTDGNAANGGTCVKTHADNCLGGELTVNGTCLCTGQVVMSGETYGLEYANGKCVPKRCPEQTVLRSGKCLAISTTAAAPEPEAARPAAPKEADEEDGHRRPCGKGMVHSHSGCVPARHRYPAWIGTVPPDLQRYYRNYQMPGFSSGAPGN
ncbi:MAG TPA: hypothetical protein VKY22_23680 [Bradyrhizobium sp.]|nr:hypothetical protein [Bradyrhizobium sp.]